MLVNKILIYSDLHIHPFKQFGMDDKGMSKRLVEQEDVLRQIRKITKDRKVDLVMEGGDIWHQDGEHPTSAVIVLQQHFEVERTPHIIVDGNHDEVRTKSPEFHDIASNIVRGMAKTVGPADIENVKVAVVNFQDDVDYKKLKGFDVVLLHKQPQWANKFGFEFEGVDWKTLGKNNRFVFFGHDHSRKELAENVIVLGPPLHLTFGDEGDRGVYILDTKTWKLEFIKLKYPEFITVDTDDQVKKDDGNYYRVRHSKAETQASNVVAIKDTPVFEERIKSENFRDILAEWLTMNGKDKSYMAVIEDIIKDKGQTVRNIFTGRLLSVVIKDFLSVGKAEYDLLNGVTFVAGRGGIKDGSGSNGAGKSSCFEAILWALTGTTTKKDVTGDDVIRWGCKDARVTLILGDATRTIRVTRSRKDGLQVLVDAGKNSESQDITEGLRQAQRQEVLEQLLGFGKSMFMAACYFSQKAIMMLTEMTDNEKTDMITGLLGFEEYEDLYKKAHTKQTDIVDKIQEDLKRTSQIEVKKARVQEGISSLKNGMATAEQDIERLDASIKECSAEIERLNTEMTYAAKGPRGLDTTDYTKIIADKENVKATIKESMADIDKEITDKKYEWKISELKGRIGKLSADRQNLDKAVRDWQYEVGHVPGFEGKDEDVRNLNSIRDKIGEIQGEIKGKEGLVRGKEHELDHVGKAELNARCDECGAFITKENIAGYIADKRKEQQTLLNEITGLQTDKQVLDIEYKELSEKIEAERTEYRKKYVDERKYKIGEAEDTLKENMASQEEITAEIVKFERALSELRKERNLFESKWHRVEDELAQAVKAREEQMKKINSMEMEKQRIQKDIDKVNNQKLIHSQRKEEIEVRIDQFMKDIKANNAAMKKIEDESKEIEAKIAKMQEDIGKLDFWKIAFSAKGIRSVLLDKFCNSINPIITEYLAITSTGAMNMILAPTSILKGGEERNKVGMIVQLKGRDVAYGALSGGQQRRVDISVVLGLNRYIGDKYGMKHGLLGLIIADELFSFLDSSAEESIGTLLHEEGRNKAIIVVSHTSELQSYSDRTYNAIMEGEETRLETA